MADFLVEVMAEWLPKAGSDWAFPATRGAVPWTSGKPGSKPLDRLKAAGLRAGVEGLTFLSLRHSWATHAESLWGFSEALIQRVLRHTTPRTAARALPPRRRGQPPGHGPGHHLRRPGKGPRKPGQNMAEKMRPRKSARFTGRFRSRFNPGNDPRRKRISAREKARRETKESLAMVKAQIATMEAALKGLKLCASGTSKTRPPAQDPVGGDRRWASR